MEGTLALSPTAPAFLSYTCGDFSLRRSAMRASLLLMSENDESRVYERETAKKRSNIVYTPSPFHARSPHVVIEAEYARVRERRDMTWRLAI